MHDILLIVLVALATHRLTYFVIGDRITRNVRDRIQVWAEKRWYTRHLDVEETEEWRAPLAYMLSCPWCVSVWVGAAVTLVAWYTANIPAPVLVWLAASSATGLLYREE